MRSFLLVPALLLVPFLPLAATAEDPDSLDAPLPEWEGGRDPLYAGADGHAAEEPEPIPCGGGIPCGCGMSVTGDVLLEEDLFACAGLGLRIAADNVIVDCGGRRIEGTGWGTGIWNPGHGGVTIRNCVIRGFRAGALALSAGDFTVENCLFEENGVAGVWLRQSDRFTVRSNRFERCGSEALGRKHGGIVTADNCREGAIEENIASDCGNGQLHVGGILLYGSRKNRIEGNLLERIAEDNIWIRMGSDGNRILRNVIRDSGMDGIWIRESDGNRVEGNDLDGTMRYGIFVRSGRRNVIRDNDVIRAGLERYAAIGVGGLEYPSTENTVAANRISLSAEGLRLEERAHGNRFEGNRVRDCGAGVRLGEGTPRLPNHFIQERIEGSGAAAVFSAGEEMIARFVDSDLGGGAILLDGPAVGTRVEIRWLIDVIVEDEEGVPLSGASVILRNGTGETVFAGTTPADGRAPRIEATAFAHTAEGIEDYNDHLLRVEGTGRVPEERSFTLDRNRTERFILRPVRTAVESGGEESAAGPLLAVRPNPFRNAARIQFTLPSPGTATVRVYDVRGREVAALAAGSFTAGAHVLFWDGRDHSGRSIPPGVYFARLSSGGRSSMVKLIAPSP